MTRTTYEATDDAQIQITDDNGFARLTNAAFDASFDGRFAEDDADEIDAALNCPNTVSEVTATVDKSVANSLYHALREAALVAESKDRDATARSLNRSADRLAESKDRDATARSLNRSADRLATALALA